MSNYNLYNLQEIIHTMTISTTLTVLLLSTSIRQSAAVAVCHLETLKKLRDRTLQGSFMDSA